MITDDMIIGDMIREARKQAKLTQQQLSDRYQIPRRSLQDWEGNKHTPPAYVVAMLVRCLEADYGVRVEAQPTSPNQTYTLTYTDGTPLSLADEAYVREENKAKRVELIDMDNPRVRTYKCANGFIFKAVRLSAR